MLAYRSAPLARGARSREAIVSVLGLGLDQADEAEQVVVALAHFEERLAGLAEVCRDAVADGALREAGLDVEAEHVEAGEFDPVDALIFDAGEGGGSHEGFGDFAPLLAAFRGEVTLRMTALRRALPGRLAMKVICVA